MKGAVPPVRSLIRERKPTYVRAKIPDRVLPVPNDLVIIAGGGIGGLATALTLHQIGVKARIFETAREMLPLGVGINLQPNAVRELIDLCLERGIETWMPMSMHVAPERADAVEVSTTLDIEQPTAFTSRDHERRPLRHLREGMPGNLSI